LCNLVLHCCPKLLNLLYPSTIKVQSGKKTANVYDTMNGVLRTFQLEPFGTNAGANIILEITYGGGDRRDGRDVFFQGHNLYLMNAQGITMRKLYDSKTWRPNGDKL
jgi:hypothetical protein